MKLRSKLPFLYFLVAVYCVLVGLNTFYVAQAFAMGKTVVVWLHVGGGIILVGLGVVLATRVIDAVWPDFRNRGR